MKQAHLPAHSAERPPVEAGTPACPRKPNGPAPHPAAGTPRRQPPSRPSPAQATRANGPPQLGKLTVMTSTLRSHVPKAQPSLAQRANRHDLRPLRSHVPTAPSAQRANRHGLRPLRSHVPKAPPSARRAKHHGIRFLRSPVPTAQPSLAQGNALGFRRSPRFSPSPEGARLDASCPS